MSSTARAVLAIAGTHLVVSRFPLSPRWVKALPTIASWFPSVAVATAALLTAGQRLRTTRDRKRDEARVQADLISLAELTSLGLAAGLNLSAALQRAAVPLDNEIRDEVRDVLRRSRVAGLGASLAAHEGHCRSMFRLVSRAVDSGAPVRAAVDAFVDDALAEERARDLAALRRLPVRLLFPLALLILPGFMVLTVGSALLGSLERLTL